ncbi:MAG: CAP domain-containing protein [Pseudomonadota bacterium]
MYLLRSFVLVAAGFLIAACDPVPPPASTGPDVIQAYRINSFVARRIPVQHLEAVNAARLAQGLVPLEWSEELQAAAQSHAVNIREQKRAWHFGSDGSSPIERAARAGFQGQLLGENVSETFENDMVTLDAWLRDPNSRSIILDPNARFIALAWDQEQNAKIWWVQLIGTASSTTQVAAF